MKTLYEGILSDMETTIETGTKQADELKHFYASHPLVGIAGVSESAEKMFTTELDKFFQEEWKSPKMYNNDLKHRDRRYPNCQHFGKWLERLTMDDLNVSFNITSMSDAEKFAKVVEEYAKKTGVLKNTRNLRIVGRYYKSNDNAWTDSVHFSKGQFQLDVQKIDKWGEVAKTKFGRVAVLYVFDCK